MYVEIDPAGVDWATVFGELGKPPDASLSSTALAFALKSSNQVEIEDEKRANEFIGRAIDRDGLERVDTGYVIEDHYETDEPDETEPDVVGSKPKETDDVDDGRDSDEIAELREEVQRLKAKNRQLDQVITLLLGELSLSEIEPNEIPALLQRVRTLDERVAQMEGDLQQQTQVTERTISKPDERAQRIRQKLVDLSGNDGDEVALTRDNANQTLNNIHRGSVIDAMKRAADGLRAADNEHTYSPIEGSSNLSPVEAIRFEVGEARDEQSRVVLETDDLTGSDFRQNLMTGEER